MDSQDKIAQKWTQSLEGQIYIVAGFRSLLGGAGPSVSNTDRKEYLLALGQSLKTDETTKKQYVESEGKTYWLTTTGQSSGQELSSGTSGYTLNFTVAPNATGTYKLFGGRADTFDPTDSLTEENSRGASLSLIHI